MTVMRGDAEHRSGMQACVILVQQWSKVLDEALWSVPSSCFHPRLDGYLESYKLYQDSLILQKHLSDNQRRQLNHSGLKLFEPVPH